MFEIPQHVYDAYKEPHRKYHNTDHIESILDKIPLFREAYDLDDYRVQMLKYIAWYHDVVYIAGNQDNEDLSIEQWLDECPDKYIAKAGVAMAIDGTATHNHAKSFYSAIFFDLDLADMGTDSYVENSFKIREEFGAFSDLEWLAGRQKFLDEFLSRPFIYHTSLGYSLWEAKARENMKLERAFLQGKYGS